MDVNYLYFRRGVERLRAAAAACAPSRAAHAELADRYRGLIRDARTARQAGGAAEDDRGEDR